MTTLDGVAIALLANVDREESIDVAVGRHAVGSGLLRTELLYLAEGGDASEERQEAVYRQAARRMAGRPVTVRILDLAPDKVLLPLGRRSAGGQQSGIVVYTTRWRTRRYSGCSFARGTTLSCKGNFG